MKPDDEVNLSEGRIRWIRERVKTGVKAVFEQLLEEEMTEHLQAECRERTDKRRGREMAIAIVISSRPSATSSNSKYPVIARGSSNRVLARARTTEVFERYKRMTGDVEEAVLEMYLQGVSTRRVGSITQALSRVKVNKDAVSRIAKRLNDEVTRWRERPIEHSFPYLILDACYLKVRWGDWVGDLALLVALGISEDGYREVLAVESAAGERKEAYREMLKALLERGQGRIRWIGGVQLVVSDDHDPKSPLVAIKFAVAAELPDARWQRCVVHFERNILAHVLAGNTKNVADLGIRPRT